MTKISILALHLSYGGVERAIINQANQLSDKYDVEIAVTYKIDKEPAFYLSPKVKVVYLTNVVPNRKELMYSLKHFKLFRLIKEAFKSIDVLLKKNNTMKKYIKETSSDIIISSRIEFTKLLKYSNKINIAEEHRHHNNDRNYINRLKKSLKNVSYLINVSKELNDFYTKEIPYVKSINIPNSLDNEKVSLSTLSNKNIVSVGRLSHEKGFLSLIDVFKEVNTLDKDIHLDIVGEGVERHLIEDKIKEYNLEKYVKLHGFKDRNYINDLYKKSSLYVMCSYEESFGLVLIEAGICGLPLIAFSSAQGANEIIKNNISGYLIDNRDIKEMASKIVSLINDKEKLKEMSKNSIKEASNYSYDIVKEKWISFIESIIKEK